MSLLYESWIYPREMPLLQYKTTMRQYYTISQIPKYSKVKLNKFKHTIENMQFMKLKAVFFRYVIFHNCSHCKASWVPCSIWWMPEKLCVRFVVPSLNLQEIHLKLWMGLTYIWKVAYVLSGPYMKLQWNWQITTHSYAQESVQLIGLFCHWIRVNGILAQM